MSLSIRKGRALTLTHSQVLNSMSNPNMDALITIALSILTSGLVTVALREVISTRIRTSIQHECDKKLKAIEFEYSQKLEQLKVVRIS